MDTSQSSFTGFSASMSGWGFPELLRITNVSDAVTYDGTLNIEADVVGDQVVDWAVYRHQWDIPSFLQLTEDETLSRPFGPPDCQWRMKIYRQGHREGEGSHFSAYIIPEKSEREHALGLAWTRPIVSLTVKIQTGNSAEPLMTKTITGGWLFRDDNLECGWSQLLELGRLTETMDWYATLSIVTEVTWDLSYDSNETDLGRVKETLSASVKEVSAIKGRFDALSQELDSSRAEAVEMKSQLTTLHADFTAAQEDNQQLTEQLRKVEARLQTLRNIEARMAVMQKEILAAQTRVEQAEIIEDRFSMVKDELAVARENQEHADALKLKVAETRARLAALRAGMEEGSALPASETEEVSQDLETMKAKVLRMQSKMHDLERDLVEARSEVDSKSRALADAAILAPVAEDDKADSIGEDASVLVRLQTVRNEILVVRGVLLEVEDRPIDSPAARASLSAELAMVQAELEVTRATFVGLTTQYVDEIEAEPDLAIEANIVATELQEVRTAMSSKRASLEEDADQPEAELTSQDRATSPIRQFPPSMQLPHATASDFGVTRTAARDAADPVPLPAGVLPPPTDLDAASHPVPNHNSHHLLLRAEEEAATAARELSFVRHERDCLQAELEETRQRMQEAREELVKNNTEVNTQGVMESLFGRRMSQSQPHLNPDYRDDHESWTPVEGHFSGVNSKNLSPQRRLLPTLLGITTTFITCWFMLYSAVYVACSPSHLEARPNALYQNVCNKAVLPAWTTVIDTWHGAAERFVFDVAPGVGETVRWTVRKSKGAMRNVRQRLESATASNEQVIDRNVILPGGDAGEPSTVTRSSAETRSTISSVARSEPAHSSVPENLTTPLPDVRVKPPAEQDERADMPRRDLGASSGDESLSEHLKQDSGRDEALPEEITFATGPPSESALPVKTPNTHSVEISSEPLSTLTIDHSKPAATHPHDIGEQPTTPVSAQEAQVPGNAVAPDPADLTDAPETEHQNGTPSGDVLQPSMEAVSPDLEANPHPMSIPDLPLPSAEFLTPVSVEPIASPSQSSQHDATDTASEGDLNSNNDGAAEGSPVEAVEEAAENEEEVHHDEADTGDEDGQHDEEIHNDIFPPASDQIPAVTYPDDVAAGNANEIDAAETAHGWDASDTPASEKAEPATKHVSDEL
ncbi:hypothetical protein DFJ77DRAFT_79168 [Powellomyces hirtus]|nr:hypothetical protein DFJ77DRAFT_79168 [Powellomyces hirtus]